MMDRYYLNKRAESSYDDDELYNLFIDSYNIKDVNKEN